MIRLYLHIATMGEYQTIHDELVNEVIDSGLIEKADILNVCSVGDEKIKPITHKNIKYLKVGKIDEFEFPTQQLLEDDAYNIKENFKALYFNGLGVTGNSVYKMSWRNYLKYFNITCHEECIKSLDEYDVCGVDWRTNPAPHYSGTFWWANSNYIKTLPKIQSLNKPDSPKILTLRHNAEMYIGMNHNAKPRILHQSNVSQYERHLFTYDKENYIDKISTENVVKDI